MIGGSSKTLFKETALTFFRALDFPLAWALGELELETFNFFWGWGGDGSTACFLFLETDFLGCFDREEVVLIGVSTVFLFGGDLWGLGSIDSVTLGSFLSPSESITCTVVSIIVVCLQTSFFETF